MKVKVCGLRDNFKEVIEQVSPDYAGLIFYPRSPRYVRAEDQPEIAGLDTGKTRKIGVFVNATVREMLALTRNVGLHGIQLHGDEPPEVARQLQNEGLQVIKAFRVATKHDLSAVATYEKSCDFFLFDARGAAYGGNGLRFDWSLLETYHSEKPFFLSGGIAPGHARELLQFQHPACYGIDINSGFEVAPAHKSVTQINDFLSELNA